MQEREKENKRKGFFIKMYLLRKWLSALLEPIVKLASRRDKYGAPNAKKHQAPSIKIINTCNFFFLALLHRPGLESQRRPFPSCAF
jgi:hypothetical protein